MWRMLFFGPMRHVILLILCVLSVAVRAQHPSYWTLDNAQGLPSLKVYDLMEDSLGVMWMGTSEGLVHYDGLAMQTLHCTNARTDGRSLLQEGRNGEVWSMNFSGELFCATYDTMLNASHLLQGLRSKLVDMQRIGDALLLLTSTERATLPLSTQKLQGVSTATAGTSHYGMAQNRWAMTSHGLLNLRTDSLHSSPNEDPSNVCTSQGADFRYYYATGTVEHLTDAGQTGLVEGLRRGNGAIPLITGARVTSAGTWVMTYDGVYLVERDAWLFPSTPISDVVEAQDGTHWFATLTDGVRVVPDLQLTRYAREPDGLPTERFNRVRNLANGNVVAADNNGMAVLIHPQRGLLATFKADVARESEALEVDTVNGRIIVAFGSLYLLDMHTLRPLAKMDGNFKSIALADDRLDVVNGPLLEHIAYDGQRFGTAERHDLKDATALKVITDAQGRSWTLTDKGVLLDGRPFAGLAAFRPRIAARGADDVLCFSNGKDSIAWMRDGEVVQWTVLAHVRQGAAVKDMAMTAGHLLVLFGNALGVMDRNTGTWVRHADGQGLPSTDLKALTVSNGRVWVASFNGLYALPIAWSQTAFPPLVLLRRLKVNGMDRPATGPLRLKYFENDLEIVLRGISTKSRGKVRFAFRLVGLMDDFEMNGAADVLRFRALAPGDYRLEVVAMDGTGQQSTTPLQLQFSIAEPWYASWMFYLAMALVLVGLVSGGFLLRIRYINQRNSRLLERSQLMQDLRASHLTALRAQMNPHFMFNVLNSIQGLFTIGSTEKANAVMSRFSELMRAILEVSGENEIPLQRELDLIALYLELEAVRLGDALSYKVQVADDLRPTSILIPSLLVQPYVENAVKHGLLHRKGEKRLLVEVAAMDNGTTLEVRITDNGIGREAAAKLRVHHHRPFATAASASRLDLLNMDRPRKIGVHYTDLMDAQGRPSGTLVVLHLPLHTTDA
jgi:ligand-binding sensor domain-containing protein